MSRRRYPSDLTDAEWTLLAPLLPAAKPGGRPRSVELREIVNAISYWLRATRRGGLAGLAARLPAVQDRLSLLARVAAERRVGADPHHSAGAAAGACGPGDHAQRGHRRQPEREDHGKGGPPGTTGFDGGKKVKGRKRHLLVDPTGLVVKALVHAANVPDGTGGQYLLAAIPHLPQALPRLHHLWVATAYQGSFKDWVEQTLGWTVEVVRRARRWRWVAPGQEPPEMPRGFQVLPRRWVVERTQPHYP